MKIYRIASKQDKEYLTPEEREEVKAKFTDIQCSFAKDKDGYYCYTHRARSKSYPSIADIPKSKVEFINSTSSSQTNVIKIASTDSDIRDLKDNVRDLKKDLKDLSADVKPMKKDWDKIDNRIKKIEKTIDTLNIGQRQFSEHRSIFNSLQRKMERMEMVEQEWKNYKKEMDDSIKKQVEKHTKARIGEIAPQAY